MRALLRQIQTELHKTREQATKGCILGSLLKRELTPEHVNMGQEWLSGRVHETENRIQVVHGRRSRRDRHLVPRLHRKEELRKLLGRHQSLLELREEVLQRRRTMLRHVGDAVAWLVCGSDPRVIAPLFDPKKDHHAPTGIGAIGPRYVRRRGHESGRFFVVDNDLTRCFGRGDLTVVPREAVGTHRVYPVELKTEGEAKVGTEAFTHAVFVTAEDDPADQQFIEDFTDMLGFSPKTEQTESDVLQRQTTEIESGRRDVFRLLSRVSAGTFPPPPQSNLKAIRQVLDRAITSGIAYDVPEAGVGYGAVRVQNNDRDQEKMDELDAAMKRAGLGDHLDELVMGNTTHLLRLDEMSVNVKPIPLWSFPVQQRSMLMTRDLILEARYNSYALRDAMREEGIDLVAKSGWWEISPSADQTIALDQVGMAKLTSQIMFEGVGVREFASHFARAIKRES